MQQRKPKAAALQPDQSKPRDFTTKDLLLMHYYTLETARTIGVVDEEAYHEVWQTRVPPLAHQFAFLMHALLGVTAAHRSEIEVARQHYGRAIADFNAARYPATGEHADAVFCFSILIMIITWSLECVNQEDPLTGAVDLLEVIRRALNMLCTTEPSSEGRSITKSMRHLQEKPETFAVPSTVDTSISKIEEILLRQHYPEDELDALQDACQRLRTFFTYIPIRPKSSLHLVRWPGSLSHIYLGLLRRGDLLALAIFAHWCVPIHHSPDRWFVSDWPRRVISSIAEKMSNTPSEAAMQWPMQEVLI